MARITFKGNEINTIGTLLNSGEQAPDFKLLKNDLTEVSLSDYSGKKKVLNIFPSLDTPVCANSVRNFNKNASALKNTVVLNISADLPFAQGRFCVSEGIKNSEVLSTFRSTFGKDYKVEIVDSPLRGLCSRVVIILDEENRILYREQVPEIAQEPDYESALKVLAK